MAQVSHSEKAKILRKLVLPVTCVLALSGCVNLPFAKKTEADLGDFFQVDLGELSQGLNVFEGTLSGICFADRGSEFSDCPESDDSDSFTFTIPEGFASDSLVVTTDNAGLGRHMGVDMPKVARFSGDEQNFFNVFEFGTSGNLLTPDNLILGGPETLVGGESYAIRLHFRPTIPQGSHMVNWRVVINVQPSV